MYSDNKNMRECKSKRKNILTSKIFTEASITLGLMQSGDEASYIPRSDMVTGQRTIMVHSI